MVGDFLLKIVCFVSRKDLTRKRDASIFKTVEEKTDMENGWILDTKSQTWIRMVSRDNFGKPFEFEYAANTVENTMSESMRDYVRKGQKGFTAAKTAYLRNV